MARPMPKGLEPLSLEEWRLLCSLREIPTGELRERVTGLAARLADFVRDPRCAEMQADGVPCADVSTACEDCQEVNALLCGIERRLTRD